MERQALDVSMREPGGKGVARRLRRTGRVPAVLYGSGIEPLSLEVEAHQLERILHAGGNAVLDLRGPEVVRGRLALVKELQRDPVSRSVLHCDLYAVDVKKRVTVSVRLHFEGKPHGVEMGGVLEPLMREVEVECLPLEIPEMLAIPVEALEIGDALHVRDIAVPDGVAMLADADTPVVHVVAPRVEEVAVAEEAAPAAEAVEAAPEGGEAKEEGSG